jgi:DNA (cytosine-5)-methyltransferase 1
MNQVTYTSIKEHRNSNRFWLEGKRLAASGFVPGATYDAKYDAETQTMTLKLAAKGQRKVSGRKRRGSDTIDPIIDICSKEMFDAGVRVRATFYARKIVVTRHHEDIRKNEREARLTDRANSGRPIREGVMCCGIGVAALASHNAFTEAGVLSTVEWIADEDGRYLQVAIDNNAAITDDTKIFEGKIEEIESELYTPVEVLSVSLPCTGQGNAGKAKNKISVAEEHPKAATSIFGLINGIRGANPAIIQSENVVDAKTSATYILLKAELVRLGYKVLDFILDGKDAGTIEQRRRWYFVAISEGIADMFQASSVTPIPRIHHQISDILDNVPEDSPMWASNDYLNDKAVRDAEAGKGFARQLVRPDSTEVGAIGRHYNKRRSTEPFVTREDGKERLFTVAEHARLKRVPEELVQGLAPTLGHEGLGQSVLFTHVTQVVKMITDGILNIRGTATAA